MSGVHDAIAMAALSVQSAEIQSFFKKYIEAFKESSWYPDYFADKSMSLKEKSKIDPEADKFIYPDPPKTSWQKKLDKLSEKLIYTDAPPQRQFYLIAFYISNAVKSLKAGDIKSAVKFCGVYSHVIADICEPIHALTPAIVDIVVPPPKEFIGLELHANVEGLEAPVNIKGYEPTLLGRTLKQAEMSAAIGLLKSHQLGAAQATPIVQALYAKQKKEAIRLSSIAQEESAKHFADFIFTVFSLAGSKKKAECYSFDLRDYPVIDSSVDMLYRYMPLPDVSLQPYSGGKLHKLEIMNDSGKKEIVKGLGVVPFLGPPFTKEHLRECWMEYYLVPGAFKKFKARVGLNTKFKESAPSAVFSIELDGKEVAKTKPLKPNDLAISMEVELGKARWLKLRMHYHNNPTKKVMASVKHLAWVSHGVWAEPILES